MLRTQLILNMDVIVIIKEVSTIKTIARKTSRDHWLLRRYVLFTIDKKSKLIFLVKETTSNIIYYAYDSELCDILQGAHIRMYTAKEIV